MKDFTDILLIGVVLSLMIVAIFVLPALAIATLPLFGVYLFVRNYQANPARLERTAQAHNQRLYEQVTSRAGGHLSEVDIQERLGQSLPTTLPADVRFHLMALARATLAQAKVSPDIPTPPLVANGIEGGRWRDQIDAIGAQSSHNVGRVVDTLAEIIRKVATVYPRKYGYGAQMPARFFVADEGELVTDITTDIFSEPLLSPIQKILDANLETQNNIFPNESHSQTIIEDYFAGTPLAHLLKFTVPFAIPTELRTAHHSVVAGSSHGKTTLFKSMIVDDLNEDACIIVINSQRGVINQLAERVDPERVILIDPRTCPPALNLFANQTDDEGGQGKALQMFNYIFESKGVEFTSQQALLYENLSRLCMVVPGASLVTMREMCQPMATVTDFYQPYIASLDDNTRSFFAEYNLPRNGRYDETRQAVLTRLQTALKAPTFAKMLGAKSMPLNLLKEIEAGKVILVNTDKDFLQAGASLFGRIITGLVMQAVRSRPELTGKRVYLYIDEFADYASDSDLMREMFTQGRKYNLCMIVAHQNLAQLTPLLAADMSASTAIKMAGGVSLDKDLGPVSKQLDCDPDELKRVPQGTFIAYFKGIGTLTWKVTAGRLESIPPHKEHVMEELRERMRREYGDKPEPEPVPEMVPDDNKDEGSFD